MPLYSLLVSMPAETAAVPLTTRLPTAALRAGGSLADVRRLHVRKEGVPAMPGCIDAAGSGSAARVGPLRSVILAREAARAWLRRKA